MTYEIFKKELFDRVKLAFDEDYIVELRQVTKNNDCKKDAILIRHKAANIAPTLYVDYFFDMYDSGYTLEEIVDQLKATYMKNKIDHDVDVSFFWDFEKLKEKIVYRLVNFNANKTMLENVPYVAYLDMAIVFYLHLECSGRNETASVLISKEMAEGWGASTEELMKLAKENSPRLMPLYKSDMRDILVEALGEDSVPTDELKTIYIASNATKLYGACVILYDKFLEEIAQELDSDLLIIPSSVHELIISATENIEELEYATRMVCEVNETALQLEEVLSDHAYYYSRKEGKIMY